jgi:hypothetical protein
VRLSFVESREKDKVKLRKRSNHNAALLSLTLTVAAAGTLCPVTLDAMALALGIFFRLQFTDFDRLLGFFSLCHFIFF